MENENLSVPLQELFSEQTLKRLNENAFISIPVDWGKDRVVTALKTRDTAVKRQFGSTCTCFATVAAIENKLGGRIDLSERFFWNLYKKYNTETAISAAKNNFLLEERFWPDHPKLARYKLSAVKDLAKNYADVLTAIDNGNPCIVALATPDDLANGKVQVEATSKVSEKSGHALCVSGYKVEKGKGYFLVKNSWGESYGDHGYQYIAFSLYDNQPHIYFWEVLDVLDRGSQQAG